MNALKLPFAAVAFIISVVLAFMAYMDISQPFFTPFRQFLSTISPILTGFLGIWVTRDAQRKQQLADDYLYDLTQLTSKQVLLFFLVRRIVDQHQVFDIPKYFVRETNFHEELRKLRRARLLSGIEGSQFRPGRKYAVARWTERLAGIAIKTLDGRPWQEIDRDVAALTMEQIQLRIREMADPTAIAEQTVPPEPRAAPGATGGSFGPPVA